MRKAKNLLGIICLVFIGLATSYASPLESPQDSKSDHVVIEKVVATYTAEIGVRELTGRNDGRRVEEYLAVTGFKKGNAWCAAFISWTFERTASELNIQIKHPKSAWAPSWFPPIKTIYNKSGSLQVGKTLSPRQADVFGIYYAKDKRIGHVGFIDEWPPNQDYAITVEGNTNNAGSREGDGVYRKRRLKQNIYKVSRWV